MLAFELSHSRMCKECGHKNEYKTNQLYIELDVPPNNSNLQEYVEGFLNHELEVGSRCEASCDRYTRKIEKKSVTQIEEARFITVILTRGIDTAGGYQLVKNKILATNDIKIR